MISTDLHRSLKANIYLREEHAGVLEKLSDNKFQFTYTSAWLASKDYSIGIAFPLTSVPYVEEGFFPFFDNLIPEGWLLSAVVSKFKIDKKNRFGLLLQTGQETIGAIKVVALDEKGNELIYPRTNLEDRKKLKFSDLNFKISEDYCSYCLQDLTLPQKLKGNGYHDKCAKDLWRTSRKLKIGLETEDPWQSFKDTVRGASVSGAQRKGLFLLNKGELLPSAFNSTFILKPQGIELESLPENEHVTMAIAKACKFKVPPFGIFSQEILGNIYVVRRFDLTQEGKHLRMEDGGQILHFSSDDKYDGTYHDLAKAIKTYSSTGLPDAVEMWKRIIFCFLTANADMHLKNWSLLEQDSLKGIFRLSSCYDLLNTRIAIPDEEIDIGLWLYEGNRKLTRKLFINFAKELKIEKHAELILENDLPLWKLEIEKLVPRSLLPEKQKAAYLRLADERFKILNKI